MESGIDSYSLNNFDNSCSLDELLMLWYMDVRLI